MTQKLHALGTLLGLVLAALSFLFKSWSLFFIAFVVGYGLAWVSHFLVEKNKPATFSHPLWSFISDFRMLYLLVTCKLK